MIQAHKVEDGGVEVVNVNAILQRTHAKVVGGTVAHAALDRN